MPQDFCLGIVTPIPKFKGHKKNVTADDFRGISVNPIASKIFEHCLIPFLGNLKTSKRQFGFKKGVGCLNSIHTVRKVIKYFNESGNTVNLGLVDLKKAFDKTPFYGILNKLIEKNINSNIVKVLESWLSNSSMKVKWNGTVSHEVFLSAGVRQGGVLSPLLFAVYVDVVLKDLKKSGLGCFVGRQCFNSFLYADDLIIISISVTDLQKLKFVMPRLISLI